MKLKPLLHSLLLLSIAPSSQAINVGEVTSIMGPEASILAKEISNTTNTARYISVNIERLSSPMAGGVIIPMETRTELLSTPASLILPGESKEVFRFFYKGPKDNKERYYRISWTDEPVTEFDANKQRKQGEATTSAVIGTILVVAPREQKFDYRRDNDTITNNGNTTFRVISYGPCRDKTKDTGQGCRERYYVMPGVSVKIKYTDLANKKRELVSGAVSNT